jgi:hypothetical protein
MTDIIAPISEAVLIEAREETTAIVPQSEAIVVEARTEAAIIAPQPEAVVIEVGKQGPAGTPINLDDLLDVRAPAPTDGDLIRYNAVTGDWESCAEPFEFQGIVLAPMALPGAPVDGQVGFNIADNGLYVAVP